MMWRLLQLDPVAQELPCGPTLWLKRLPSGPAEPEPQGRGWVVDFATVSKSSIEGQDHPENASWRWLVAQAYFCGRAMRGGASSLFSPFFHFQSLPGSSGFSNSCRLRRLSFSIFTTLKVVVSWLASSYHTRAGKKFERLMTIWARMKSDLSFCNRGKISK